MPILGFPRRRITYESSWGNVQNDTWFCGGVGVVQGVWVFEVIGVMGVTYGIVLCDIRVGSKNEEDGIDSSSITGVADET